MSAETSTRGDSPGQGNVEKLPRIRQVIAKRMVESLSVSAQLTSVQEVDMSNVVALRDSMKDAFRAEHGVPLTYLAFIAVAVAGALAEYPRFNASLTPDGKNVEYHDDVHLSIAVDTPRGLLVPVIRHADRLDVSGLARSISDIGTRAREGRIEPDEMVGGTFTITNIGSAGALLDTPIINQPQVAILGTGAITKQPKVFAGADGDEIRVRSVCYLPLTYDHRLIDGADAGRFVGHVKQRLEDARFDAVRSG